MTRRGGTGPTLVVSALLAAALLSGCSGGSGGSGGSGNPGGSGGSGGSQGSTAGRTPSASATTAYPSGAPTGTVLTEPGTTLTLGTDATVSWEPRQGQVGTVRIKVDRIERTTFVKSFRDWRVDATTKTFAPYFVRAHVTNVGTSDLGGAAVPLYGESAANALVEPAVFKETFKPCHPSALPKPFPVGRSVPVCVVYLVPARGQLVGAAFRPTQDFAPIVWKSTP